MADGTLIFDTSRVPHGTRGLKLLVYKFDEDAAKSRPAWDAWIEIAVIQYQKRNVKSRPAWDAWIEI